MIAGAQDPGGRLIVRRLRFVEFMELLEFSHLRFEEPAGMAQPALIGTQEWRCRVECDASDTSDIYVCSTLEALHNAVLVPEDAELDIDATSGGKVRLRAVAKQGPARPRPPWVRVDLHTLIHRVMVAGAAPAHLYELVRHLVMTRLWIEVGRVTAPE